MATTPPPHPPGGLPRPVLHVIDGFDCGGAQELLVLLGRTVPRDPYPTAVAVIQPATGMIDRLRATGVRVHCLDRPRPSILNPVKFIAYVLGVVRDIRRICRAENTAVVHCHLSDAEFLGTVAARLARVERVLLTVHTPFLLPTRRSLDPRNALRAFLTRRIFNLADRVIAVSAETGRILEGLGVDPGRIRVVENGIDVRACGRPSPPGLRAELGLAPGRRVLVTVARLTLQKGHANLIEALPGLVLRHPDIALLLLGEGELRQSLAAQAEYLGVSRHVAFLGVRSDVPDVLALADIFVLPSLWEGTSLALLEAMARGLPIVATDIDGNRPLLAHERDCLLVPAGDPAALEAAVGRLLEDPDLARRLGETARSEALDRFDIHVMLKAYEALWAAHPGEGRS